MSYLRYMGRATNISTSSVAQRRETGAGGSAEGLFSNVFGGRRGPTESVDYFAELEHLSRYRHAHGWLYHGQPDFQAVLVSEFNGLGNGAHCYVCLGYAEEGSGIGRGNGKRQFAVVTMDRDSLADDIAVNIELWGDDLQAAISDASGKFSDGRSPTPDNSSRSSVRLDRGHVTEFSEVTWEDGFRKLWTPPHRRADPESEPRHGSLLEGF